MKNYFLALLFLLALCATAQSHHYKITYLRSSNGKTIENQPPILVLTNSLETVITNQQVLDQKAEFPNETLVVDRKKSDHVHTFAQLSTTQKIATLDSVSVSKQQFEFSDQTKKILGYTCKKAKTVINSNTIELWYTDQIPVKGAPTLLGQNLGLVLEMNRNENFVVQATKIEKVKPLASTLENTKKNATSICCPTATCFGKAGLQRYRCSRTNASTSHQK